MYELSPLIEQCVTETSVLIASGSHTHFSWALAVMNNNEKPIDEDTTNNISRISFDTIFRM